VRGIIGKILVGRQHGIDTFFIPSANLAQARLVPNVTLMPVDTLADLYKTLQPDRHHQVGGHGVRQLRRPGR